MVVLAMDKKNDNHKSRDVDDNSANQATITTTTATESTNMQESGYFRNFPADTGGSGTLMMNQMESTVSQYCMPLVERLSLLCCQLDSDMLEYSQMYKNHLEPLLSIALGGGDNAADDHVDQESEFIARLEQLRQQEQLITERIALHLTPVASTGSGESSSPTRMPPPPDVSGSHAKKNIFIMLQYCLDVYNDLYLVRKFFRDIHQVIVVDGQCFKQRPPTALLMGSYRAELDICLQKMLAKQYDDIKCLIDLYNRLMDHQPIPDDISAEMVEYAHVLQTKIILAQLENDQSFRNKLIDHLIEEQQSFPSSELASTSPLYPFVREKDENIFIPDDVDSNKLIKTLLEKFLLDSDYVMNQPDCLIPAEGYCTNGQPPYQCPQCRREFEFDYDLQFHLIAHKLLQDGGAGSDRDGSPSLERSTLMNGLSDAANSTMMTSSSGLLKGSNRRPAGPHRAKPHDRRVYTSNNFKTPAKKNCKMEKDKSKTGNKPQQTTTTGENRNTTGKSIPETADDIDNFPRPFVINTAEDFARYTDYLRKHLAGGAKTKEDSLSLKLMEKLLKDMNNLTLALGLEERKRNEPVSLPITGESVQDEPVASQENGNGDGHETKQAESRPNPEDRLMVRPSKTTVSTAPRPNRRRMLRTFERKISLLLTEKGDWKNESVWLTLRNKVRDDFIDLVRSTTWPPTSTTSSMALPPPPPPPPCSPLSLSSMSSSTPPTAAATAAAASSPHPPSMMPPVSDSELLQLRDEVLMNRSNSDDSPPPPLPPRPTLLPGFFEVMKKLALDDSSLPAVDQIVCAECRKHSDIDRKLRCEHVIRDLDTLCRMAMMKQ